MRRLFMKGPLRRKLLSFLVVGGISFAFGVCFLCGTCKKKDTTKSSLERNADLECVRWEATNKILPSSEPLVKTDHQKLLLPILYNGPTNQLWGLRQAVYLAIILNRTLVMPVFRKHLTDNSGPDVQIDPNHRFQVETLSSFVSIAALEEYHRECKDSVETVFLAKKILKWAIPVLNLAEEELGLNFLQRPKHGRLKLSDPFLPDIKVFPPMSHDADLPSIKSHFQSEDKCVLYVLPFREIKMETKRSAWEKEYKQSYKKFSHHLTQVPDWSIVHAIYLYTQPPKYVQEITSKFLQHMFGDDPYVAIHWRYDLEDFEAFMCNKEDAVGNPHQADMCKKVGDVTPEGLSEAVGKHVLKIGEDVNLIIRKVYIATPRTPSALQFIKRLSQSLSKFRLDVFSQSNLEEFMRHSGMFEVCHFFNENFNDILSLSEMEICSQSSVFLRSTYSSWSDTITINRVLWQGRNILRKMDKNVISLFENAKS